MINDQSMYTNLFDVSVFSRGPKAGNATQNLENEGVVWVI